jgi:hypothetical protein
VSKSVWLVCCCAVCLLSHAVAYVDFSSPEKILDWLKGLVDQCPGLELRTNAFDPGAPLVTELHRHKHFGNVCWDREQVTSLAVNYFRRVAVGGATENLAVLTTLAARGCGKSFIFDHLCRLHDVRDDGGNLILGEELNSRLVPVCISFILPIDGDFGLKTSSKAKMFIRMADHARFIGSKNWVQFRMLTEGVWDQMDPFHFFDALLLWFKELGVSNPIMLLAVDEVARCGQGHETEIIKMCKMFLERFVRNCCVLVTTIDDLLVKSAFGDVDNNRVPEIIWLTQE